jgi:hypothetical protein
MILCKILLRILQLIENFPLIFLVEKGILSVHHLSAIPVVFKPVNKTWKNVKGGEYLANMIN